MLLSRSRRSAAVTVKLEERWGEVAGTWRRWE